MRDFNQRKRLLIQHRPTPAEEGEPQRDVQQAQSHHGQTHHRARAESDLQALVERLLSARRGSAAGPGGGFHSEPTCCSEAMVENA